MRRGGPHSIEVRGLEPPSCECVLPMSVTECGLKVLITVTVILAVSTTLPNPLQALAQLHSRALELPSWVDNTHLRYSLIVHPENSPLSDEE
jgi:hypothetical protein